MLFAVIEGGHVYRPAAATCPSAVKDADVADCAIAVHKPAASTYE